MGLVQDLLERHGYVWSDCYGTWSCHESHDDDEGMHLGV